jgi:hypothetical protein
MGHQLREDDGQRVRWALHKRPSAAAAQSSWKYICASPNFVQHQRQRPFGWRDRIASGTTNRGHRLSWCAPVQTQHRGSIAFASARDGAGLGVADIYFDSSAARQAERAAASFGSPNQRADM